MQIKVITNSAGFLDLKKDWERLLQCNTDVVFYQTFDYNWIWWNIYKKNNTIQLFMICVYHQKKLIGLAPLVIQHIKQHGMIKRLLKFCGISNHNTFFINQSFYVYRERRIIKAIFKAIMQNKDQWDRLYLNYINSKTDLAAYIFKDVRFNPNFSFQTEMPYLQLPNQVNFKEYMDSNLPPYFFRHQPKFKRETGYVFGQLNPQSKNIDHIFHFILFKAKKNFSLPLNHPNILSMLNTLLKHDAKRVYFLKTKANQMIAVNIFFEYDKMLSFLYTGYHPDYKKVWPGHILLYEILLELSKNNKRYTIDLQSGKFPWKFMWTRDINFCYTLDIS